MRQFVKVLADGRVSLVHTTSAAPIVGDGEVIIETTDAPIPRGVDITVTDGVVTTAPRGPSPAPEWAEQEEPQE